MNVNFLQKLQIEGRKVFFWCSKIDLIQHLNKSPSVPSQFNQRE